jgi:hypothetical protein
MSESKHLNFLENITDSLNNYTNTIKYHSMSTSQTQTDAKNENYIFMTKVLYLILIIGLTLFFGFLPLIWYIKIHFILQVKISKKYKNYWIR